MNIFRLKFPNPIKAGMVLISIIILISIFSAFAATINIPSVTLGGQSYSVSANSFKPASCSGINLTNIISGSGTITGTVANDLIIGSSAIDTIDGLGGDDCILGGGGADTITGNSGTDICLGGPDSDIFITCETQIE